MDIFFIRNSILSMLVNYSSLIKEHQMEENHDNIASRAPGVLALKY